MVLLEYLGVPEQALGWSPGPRFGIGCDSSTFMHKWLCLLFSLDYLKQIAGPRTVPIELGSRYTDKEWTQKLMTLSEFIINHVSNTVSNDAGMV